jgi:hypothetical protein
MPSLPGFSPIEAPYPKASWTREIDRNPVSIHHRDANSRYPEQIEINRPNKPRGRCEMKQLQKRFLKEVVVDATILSALVIVPLAFLGPGLD